MGVNVIFFTFTSMNVDFCILVPFPMYNIDPPVLHMKKLAQKSVVSVCLNGVLCRFPTLIPSYHGISWVHDQHGGLVYPDTRASTVMIAKQP